MATKTKYAFAAAEISGDNIDRETGRMLNVSLVSFGPAIGHGTYVDEETLVGVEKAIQNDKLPAYITHRGAIFDDRLTREVGYFHSFRILDNRVMADFQAFDSFMEDESRKFNRLFELAETMPKRFGLSIVFSANLVWSTAEGDTAFAATEDPPDNAMYPHPSLRVIEVNSADFVDSPAANARGLFSRIDKPQKSMTKNELETLSQDLEAEKVELVAKIESTETERDELSAKAEAAEASVIELSGKVTEAEAARDMLAAEKVELTAKVEAADAALSEATTKVTELTEASEATATELAAKVQRITELEALINGNEPVSGKSSPDPQPVSKAERDQIVTEFAKQHGINESAAVIRLSREQPHLWKS